MLDLLDLYINFRPHTVLGAKYANIDKFIALKGKMLKVGQELNLPRFDGMSKDQPSDTAATDQTTASSPQPLTGIGLTVFGDNKTSGGGVIENPTVRYMLDPGRARNERAIVDEHFRTEPIEE